MSEEQSKWGMWFTMSLPSTTMTDLTPLMYTFLYVWCKCLPTLMNCCLSIDKIDSQKSVLSWCPLLFTLIVWNHLTHFCVTWLTLILLKGKSTYLRVFKSSKSFENNLDVLQDVLSVCATRIVGWRIFDSPYYWLKTWRFPFWLNFIVLFHHFQGATTRWEPQIATLCEAGQQFHPQHLSEDGRWVTDLSIKTPATSCLRDKMDLLEHCKKVRQEFAHFFVWIIRNYKRK